MNQIVKHSFEAVSLLTTNNGMLDVTIIPAHNQPDWIIPSSLVLSIDDYHDRVWTYLWEQQEVAVFHLLSPDTPIDKTIVLEGNTISHRMALQTVGNLQQMKVRISDVKDTELPECYAQITGGYNHNLNTDQPASYRADNNVSETQNIRFRENIITSYMFQTVLINDVVYLIPDLDKIAHQLVDLDS